MAQRNYCFDIEPMWGSHSTMLEESLSKLAPGSLVIEHGAGMYSSPLISRFSTVDVLCIEEAPGWRSWAQWLYQTAGRPMTLLKRAKEAIPHLGRASLVLIDGAARERSDLLKWALDAGVPCVIAHDTHDPQYGYRIGQRGDYRIEADSNSTQTTRWTKSAPL